MLRNKKGQGLSMTMVVVIILAVLVLAVIALIFLGGTGGIVQKLRDIFVPQSGTALNLALEQCETWCDQAKDSDTPGNTAYCTRSQHVDKEGDGKADKHEDGKLIDYFCDNTNYNTNDIAETLGVKCSEVLCRG
tara:strand:- start:347 stop:748 length:402 start_codon:yes stop_codon:yes gene_type:complete